MAIITKDKVKLLNIFSLLEMSLRDTQFKYLNILDRKEKLNFDVQDIRKNGFPHFMLKKNFEQPESITKVFTAGWLKTLGQVKILGW